MTHRRLRRLALCAAALAGFFLFPTTPAGAEAAPPQITKRDLAVAYLRLEDQLQQVERSSDTLGALNQEFDRASLRLLAGDAAAALQGFDRLTLSLRGEPAAPLERWLLSLRVRIHPPVASRGAEVPALRATVAMLYPADRSELADDAGAVLRVIDDAGTTVASANFTVGEIGEAATLRLSMPEMPAAGMHRITLLGAGRPIDAGSWQVVETSMDEARTGNEARLEALARATPELATAVSICRGRNARLADVPPASEVAALITSQHALHVALAEEIAALESGRDPYAQRSGDLWRTVETPTGEIPFRIYVPEGSAAAGNSMPLVIALHGAGADENMFFEGYGRGALKRLADQHRFIAVTPSVYQLGEEAFEALLADLSARHPIDGKRVYVLGHSLGGGAAWALGMLCRERIAAVACLAGVGAAVGDASRAPTLVLAGELDPIISAAALRQATERAAATGAPVEYREKQSYGHTLIVNDRLGEVIEWLLTHAQ